MNENKKRADQLRKIADEIDPPFDQISEPPKAKANRPAGKTQQELEAEYNAGRKGKMIISLNSAASKKKGRD